MSLPASNRKAPSRAAIAATLFALGATSAVAQNAQPSYGYGQQLPAAPFGYAQQAPYGAPAGFPGYAVQPASTYAQPVPQGYAQPAPQGYADPVQQLPVPQLPGYGAPQPFPGYSVPGGYPATGYGSYADPFGASSQWSEFAPSEPTYAPAERVGSTSATTAASPAPVQSATVTTTVAPDYTYEVAPATGSTYVGTSSQISTGTDPYQVVLEQQQAAAPSYTQQYEAAPAQQQYEAVAAYPAPQAQPSESVNIGGYEYQAAPQQPSADYFDLSAQQTAAAAAAALSVAPQQQVVVAAPVLAAIPALPQGAHFVQVGAFVDPARANNLVNQLGSAGEQAIVIPAQVRGKLYHRVRVLAASKRDARIVRDRIRNLGYYEARVVKG